MNIAKIRKNFPIYQNERDFIYLDNGTTTLKHKVAIEAVNDYMTKSTSNVFDNDFPWSKNNAFKLEQARIDVAKFMGCSKREVIFSFGTTSLIFHVTRLLRPTIKAGDEIIINNHEHSANHLTWLKLAQETKAKLVIIELESNQKLVDVIENYITDKTKIIAFAAATNVTGRKRDIGKLAQICNKNNIISVVDGAQYVAANKLNCHKWDIDFFIWGAHKIFAPTGIGVMYGKYLTLKKYPPQILAGSTVNKCNLQGEMILKPIPYCYEYGTQNIPAILATGAICKWINEFGIDKINHHVYSLRAYALKKMSKIKNIEIYNQDFISSTIVFNIKNIPAQDVADYLGKRKIAVRAGDMCAKLNNFNASNNSIRVVFSIYNDKNDVNTFISLLKDISLQKVVEEIIANE